MLRRTQGILSFRQYRSSVPTRRECCTDAIELSSYSHAGTPYRLVRGSLQTGCEGQFGLCSTVRVERSVVHTSIVVWEWSTHRIATRRRIHLLVYGHPRRRLLQRWFVQTRPWTTHHRLRSGSSTRCGTYLPPTIGRRLEERSMLFCCPEISLSHSLTAVLKSKNFLSLL